MSVSLPSKEAIVVDIPEVKNFTPTFVYDFFTPDEMQTDDTNPPRTILNMPSEKFDAAFIDIVKLKVPRFVKFTFTPVVLADKSKVVNSTDVRANAGTTRVRSSNVIRKNLSKIINEDDFAANSFVAVNFSDQSIDVKLHDFVSGSVNAAMEQIQQQSAAHAAKLAASNAALARAGQAAQAQAAAAAAATATAIASALAAGLSAATGMPPSTFIGQFQSSANAQAQAAFSGLNSFGQFLVGISGPSITQIAKTFDGVTPPEIRFNFISRTYGQPARSGAFFYENNVLRQNESLEKLKDVFVHTQLNAKFMENLIRSSLFNPTITFSSDLVNLYTISKTITKNALQRTAQSITNDEYKTYVQPYDTCAAQSVTAGDRSAFKILGYVIDKYEVLPDRSMKKLDPIVLENPRVGSAVDLKVRYGATYVYSIRTIVEFTVPAIDDDTQELVVTKLLISSHASKPFYVDCHENVPPPSPTDFSARWDYLANQLILTWTFPPNSQQDVKKFQVFRRASLDEPFQLLKQYDFDDSVTKVVDNEQVPSHLVQQMVGNPSTSYVDLDFTKSSKFIYALCSIDAHGLTSNYSDQFELAFDSFKNKVVKKLVSSSGAPKSYPNTYVTATTFVDTMTDENHTQARLYFMPDFMQLYDDLGNVTPAVATDQTGGSYRLQFINIDLQQQSVVNVTVADKRLRADLNAQLYNRRGPKAKAFTRRNMG